MSASLALSLQITMPSTKSTAPPNWLPCWEIYLNGPSRLAAQAAAVSWAAPRARPPASVEALYWAAA